MFARCKMAKTGTHQHGSPHSEDHKNCLEWWFAHLRNEFAAAECVLLFVVDLTVAQQSICLGNIEVLFPCVFLPENDVKARQTVAETRSTKKMVTLSQIGHIRHANGADRSFARSDFPPDRSWL